MKVDYDLKWEILKNIARKGASEINEFKFSYYHYTGLANIYNILDGDSIWGANVRFSNDKTEEQMYGSNKYHDDYIICFCGFDDRLSQWRGYCHDGGGAIRFDINSLHQYSVLHSDYDISGRYELYENRPLPVVYISKDIAPLVNKRQMEYIINGNSKYKDITTDDLLPYLKNGHFFEEKESRLVFSNTDNVLSKCIRFRTIDEGVKIPYVVIKFGDIGKQKTKCSFDLSAYDDDKIREIIDNRKSIFIDEGYDQENVFNDLTKRL